MDTMEVGDKNVDGSTEFDTVNGFSKSSEVK